MTDDAANVTVSIYRVNGIGHIRMYDTILNDIGTTSAGITHKTTGMGPISL